MPPPLSPVLLAGLAVAPLPLAPLEVALELLLRRLAARRPELFDRLAALGERSLVVAPSDLPFSAVLALGVRPPRLRLVRGEASGVAVVRAPLVTLLDLVRGRCDGDALFFSRDLAVAGDSELVVTLRNALERAGLDPLEEAIAACAPLDAPLRQALAVVAGLDRRFGRDLARLQEALLAPLRREVAGLAARLDALERRPLSRFPSRPPAAAP